MRENMTEFYAKYHLNKYNFGEYAGVGARTLLRYAEGKQIREDSLNRIEKAIRVVKKYDLVKPTTYHSGPDFTVYGYMDFDKEMRKYEERFKTLLAKEES